MEEFKIPSVAAVQTVVADKLDRIDALFQEVDITQLVQFERKIKEIGSFNKVMASHYLRDFIDAIDVSNEMLSRALLVQNKAKAVLDEAKSIAYLDHASVFLAKVAMKDTVDARKAYVDRDPDVVRAKDIYAKAEAYASLLNNKVWTFRYAHDDIKKIAYADQRLTNFEGM